MKAYIAFSIHGTNAFITAHKTFGCMDEIAALEPEFTVVKSRRENYKSEDGVKLAWTKLMVTETSSDPMDKQTTVRPLRSPVAVIVHFKTLKRRGWTVDKTAFVRRHWGKTKNRITDSKQGH